MRFREIMEATETLTVRPRQNSPETTEIMVRHNPTAAELLGLWQRSTHREVRGLVLDREVYFWDADDGLHSFVSRALGYGLRGIRLKVGLHDGGPAFVIDPVQWRVIHHPGIQPLLASGRFRIVDWIDDCPGTRTVAEYAAAQEARDRRGLNQDETDSG